MATSTTDTMAHIATGAAVGTGISGYLTANATMVTIVIGITSLLIGLLFYVLNYRLNLRQVELGERQYKEEMDSIFMSRLKEKEIDEEQFLLILEAMESVKDSRQSNSRKGPKNRKS